MKKFMLASLTVIAATLSPIAGATEMPVTADCAVTGDIEMVASEGQSDRITVMLAGKQDGPDVVLVPGLSTPREVWDNTVRSLAGCYRLHLVQVRGFGDAPGANAEGPVLDPLVHTVADYIDDMIFDTGRGKPKIIGHSFGGLTAMKVGLAIPEKVSGVMVVDALPFFGAMFGATSAEGRVEQQAAAMRKGIQAAKEPGLDAMTLKTMSRSKEGREKILEWVKQGSNMVAGQVLYDVMTADIREELKENKVPLTMLYPINPDSPFPADMTENLYKSSYATVPNVTLKRIDDSAHFIMLDQSEKFMEAAMKFLAGEAEAATDPS